MLNPLLLLGNCSKSQGAMFIHRMNYANGIIFEISVIIGCLLVNGEAHPVYQCRCFVRSRTYFYLMHINSTVRNTRRRWHAWAAYPSMNVFGESMGYFVRSRNSALILVANATYNGPTERDIIHVNEYSARSYSETNILRKYYYLPT
ncbi:hypothetical protein ABKN59_003940 [Abortiporus biennis]